MIKGVLYGIDKFNSKSTGDSCCFLHLGVAYNQKKENAIGNDYMIASCYGDEADRVYDVVIKNKLIGENVYIGGMIDDYHKCTCHDIEKAK